MGRGEKIGLPTINLDQVNLDIDYGVYSVEAEIDGLIYKGLLHFGLKETFGEAASLELFIEEHILNITQKNVKIKVGHKIREIRKFSSVEELKKQVNRDLEELSLPKPPQERGRRDGEAKSNS